MIIESYSWKNELYKNYLIIAKFRHLKNMTEQSYIEVEKALMISAYIIRKLYEAEKIPPKMLKQIISIEKFENNNVMVDYLNHHKCEKNYKMESSTLDEVNWLFFINQIIHSFSFKFFYDEKDELIGFLINSDNTKNKSLFLFSIKQILFIILSISEGQIVNAISKREVIGLESDGITKKYGEMRLVEATYSYPHNFRIEEIIEQTMKGQIYKRKSNKILRILCLK